MTFASRADRRVVLLDRDGVLNVDRAASVRSLGDLEVAPGAIEGAELLRDDGFTLVVASNQACVGRGQLSPAGLTEINEELNRRLGDSIAAWFVCTHSPDEGCECRKPAAGLLNDAQSLLGFDLASTWFVGDDDRDVEAALGCGCRPALLRTGKGVATARGWPDVPVFDDLRDFALWRRATQP
jgi:D-glycero-D-manno-heptose 1,7-bisphosphate phosphatase